jgi:MFS family permease
LALRARADALQAAMVTVANLYYAQPILNVIAMEFDVSYERASNVAALSQAGYAVGLAFICPVADMVPRRPFILFLMFATATVVSRAPPPGP